MADVFISYAREDSGFVHGLNSALKARGRETSLDIQDLLPAEEWASRVEDLIAQADSVVFIISPDSVTSTSCGSELDLALRLNKRLIPLLRREVEDMRVPAPLRSLNWLFFRECDDFEQHLQDLVEVFDTEPEYVRQHTWLIVRAREWETAGRDGSLLLRGAALQIAQSWLLQATSKHPAPTQLQAVFVDSSVRAAKGRQLWAIVILTVFLCIAIGLAAWAELNRRESVAQAKIAHARELMAHAHTAPSTVPQRKILLVIEAARLLREAGADTASAEELLQLYLGPGRSRLLVRNNNGVSQISFSPKGNRLASADDAGMVTLWDMNGDNHEATVFESAGSVATAMVFAQDGGKLAVGFRNGQVKLWRMEDVKAPAITIPSDESEITALLFAAGDRLLVAGHRSGALNAWVLDPSANSHREVQSGKPHDGLIAALTPSPDGRHMASIGEDGKLLIWSLDDLRAPQKSIDTGASALTTAAYSPSAAPPSILTGGRDGRVILWHPSESNKAEVIARNADAITALRYSADGRWFAASSLDGRVYLWNMSSMGDKRKPIKLLGHTNWVSGIAFSPDSKRLASYSYDGTVLVWELRHIANPPLVLAAHEYPVTGVTFSTSSDALASASRDASVRIWTIANSAKAVTEGLDALIERACHFVARNFYLDEWDLYFRESTRRRTCTQWDLPAEPVGFFVRNHRLMSVNGAPVRFMTAASFGATSEILPEFLIMHATAGGQLNSALNFLDSPNAYASLHALVDRDGTIVQLVPFDKIAYHAGQGKWGGRSNLNRFSIGIQLVNEMALNRRGNGWVNSSGQPVPSDQVVIVHGKHKANDGAWQAYTAVQLLIMRQMGKVLVRHYGIRDALGHDEISPERKVDPGPAFPMQPFREFILPHRQEP